MSSEKAEIYDPDHELTRLRIIATAVVMLAVVGIAGAIAFTLLDKIPFHHIFPGSECSCAIGMDLMNLLVSMV